MHEDIIEIRYGGINPFDNICNTPLVEYGVKSDGWFKNGKNIKLQGQILCCGLSIQEIFQKQNALKYNFRNNYLALKIISLDGYNGPYNNGVIIDAPLAHVKSITFDESDYKYILPFTIEIESHNEDSFAGAYRVTDPVLRSGENDIEGGGKEFFIECSAKGLEGDGYQAVIKAKNWVEAAQNSVVFEISTLCNPSNPIEIVPVTLPLDEPTISEISEDTAQGTYRVFKKWIRNPKDEEVTDPNTGKKYFVSYQYSVSTSTNEDNSSVSVSINGSARSQEKDGAIIGFLTKDWLGLAQQWAASALTKATCTMALNPKPSSMSHSEPSDEKSISFSLTYKSIPCDKIGEDVCGETSTSYNYSESGLSSKSEESSYSLSITVTARGTCGTKSERRAWAEEKIGGVVTDPSELVGLPLVEWELFGTSRDNNSESVSVTHEYRASIKKNPDGGGNNNLPCDIESVDGSISESLPSMQYNFKRANCPHWLAIPTSPSFYKKTVNLTVKYKGTFDSARNYGSSLIQGRGQLIKDFIIHDPDEKTIEFEYEWEDNSPALRPLEGD